MMGYRCAALRASSGVPEARNLRHSWTKLDFPLVATSQCRSMAGARWKAHYSSNEQLWLRDSLFSLPETFSAPYYSLRPIIPNFLSQSLCPSPFRVQTSIPVKRPFPCIFVPFPLYLSHLPHKSPAFLVHLLFNSYLFIF